MPSFKEIKRDGKMPALFVGHGSPMNAVEDTAFTRGWEKIAREIPRPEAILAISAHWYTAGTHINDEEEPKTVYDMYGFPEELYKVTYPAKGDRALARLVADLLPHRVQTDNSWGIDHGVWSVLHRMYPEADIPVCEMSVDRTADPQAHFEMGRALGALRDKGVLLLASGNVVHNLRRVDWNMEGGYPWAEEFDGFVKQKVEKREFADVVSYRSAGEHAQLSVPTPDHFYPLLYVLGAAREDDSLTVRNHACCLGGLSMTSYLFQ